MPLSNYAEQCGALASELADSLSETDLAAIHELLDGRDRLAWEEWRVQHESLVREYVSATASQRARKKSWRPAQPLLTLAAIQHCLEGQALLQVIDGLEPGHSYRNMAAMAGQAYQNLMGNHIPDWPFDDDPPSMFV